MNVTKALTVLVFWLALGITLAQNFPVTVKHKYGSTTIEAQPERIVTLGYTDQDAVYAVGDKPVAVRHWFGEFPHDIFPWAEGAADGAAPEVLNMTELNMEAILGLEPDLITAANTGITNAEYMQLSQIAPTVAQSGDYQNYGTPWQEMTESIGQALGKGEEAKTAVDKVEQAFSNARAEHPGFEGKSIAVVVFIDDAPHFVYQSQENRSRFFTNLGFEVPVTIDELPSEGFSVTLSEERYDLLDQDVLVILNNDETPEGQREKVESNPLLAQLDVVKNGRTVYVTGINSEALNFGSVLSLPYALENILTDLTDAASRPE